MTWNFLGQDNFFLTQPNLKFSARFSRDKFYPGHDIYPYVVTWVLRGGGDSLDPPYTLHTYDPEQEHYKSHVLDCQIRNPRDF